MEIRRDSIHCNKKQFDAIILSSLNLPVHVRKMEEIGIDVDRNEEEKTIDYLLITQHNKEKCNYIDMLKFGYVSRALCMNKSLIDIYNLLGTDSNCSTNKYTNDEIDFSDIIDNKCMSKQEKTNAILTRYLKSLSDIEQSLILSSPKEYREFIRQNLCKYMHGIYPSKYMYNIVYVNEKTRKNKTYKTVLIDSYELQDVTNEQKEKIIKSGKIFEGINEIELMELKENIKNNIENIKFNPPIESGISGFVRHGCKRTQYVYIHNENMNKYELSSKCCTYTQAGPMNVRSNKSTKEKYKDTTIVLDQHIQEAIRNKKKHICFCNLCNSISFNKPDMNVSKSYMNSINELYKNKYSGGIMYMRIDINLFRLLSRNKDISNAIEYLEYLHEKSNIYQNNTVEKALSILNRIKKRSLRDNNLLKVALILFICDALNVHQVINCKQGKDRTTMAVIYKESLQEYYDIYRKLPDIDAMLDMKHLRDIFTENLATQSFYRIDRIFPGLGGINDMRLCTSGEIADMYSRNFDTEQNIDVHKMNKHLYKCQKHGINIFGNTHSKSYT